MIGFVLAAAVAASAALQDPRTPRPSEPGTCAAASIAPDSYRLTVEAQAFNLTTPYHRWWDNYDLGQRPKDADMDAGAVAIAERARELDDRNLLAHAQLARQYLVTGVDARKAHEEWRRTLDAGAAIVWLTTLFDVDDRAYFVTAFDRQGIRIFKLGQLAGAVRMDNGVPVLPGPDYEDFWRAMGGCLPDGLQPEATVPWSDVREIESGNFVLWFGLNRAVTINSDRGNRRRLTTLMINLHRATGDADFRYGAAAFRGPVYMPPATFGPAAYQERVRQTIVELFDPERRIKVPPQRRAGW
jgi:hypothetical protein